MTDVMAVERRAPSGDEVTDYDCRNLALYAALLDADDAGRDWREAAAILMGIDETGADSEACWRSHLDRAQWIVGGGLASAVTALSRRSQSTAQ